MKEPHLQWQHLADIELYADNKHALAELKRDNIQLEKKTIFHSFWQGEISRKQAFSLKSFICTQDLSRAELILWLHKDHGYPTHQDNPFLKPLLKFMTVKSYDAFYESENTILRGCVMSIPANEMVHYSDAFRTIILAKYGGVYFDLDIMFLRDIRPLLDHDFCYAWERQPYANTAILHIKKNSALIPYLHYKCFTEQCFHPWIIYQYKDLKLKSLMVYPCTFFDPIWMSLHEANDDYPFNNFEGFFKAFDQDFTKKENIDSYLDFFTGAYAYHWHNQWNCYEFEDSYFGIFDKEFDRLIHDVIVTPFRLDSEN